MQNSAATDSHPAQTFDPIRTISLLHVRSCSACWIQVGSTSQTNGVATSSNTGRTSRSLGSAATSTGPLTALINTPSTYPQIDTRVDSALLAWAARELAIKRPSYPRLPVCTSKTRKDRSVSEQQQPM